MARAVRHLMGFLSGGILNLLSRLGQVFDEECLCCLETQSVRRPYRSTQSLFEFVDGSGMGQHVKMRRYVKRCQMEF